MKTMSFDVELPLAFDAAIEAVSAALKEEGFGVLTRVNLHDAFQTKLGKEFRPYAILGACNPTLAFQAISSQPAVGLLLPCNVTVEWVSDGRCLVRIVDPRPMMAAGGMDDEPAIREVAETAHEKLSRVAQALARS